MSTQPFARLIDVTPSQPQTYPAKTPLELAYERVCADIASVTDDELANLNVDVPSAITTAQAAVPTLRGLRPTIARTLTDFDLAQFDKLSDYADALAHLQTEFVHQDAPVSELPAMYDEAIAFRETVLSVGRVLVKLQLLDSSVFDAAGTVTGYRNVAYELGNLCSRLLENWSAIAGRCALTEEQLIRGKTLGTQLLAAVARREQAQAKQGAVAKDRQRAFTLLSRAYNEARRAVVYLRWNEGDADSLVQSFYGGRAGGRKSTDAEAPAAIAALKAGATQHESTATRPDAPIAAKSTSPALPALSPDDDPFYPA